ALAIDPKLAPAHTSLGLALYAQKNVDGAIRCYQAALAADPKYAKAHGALGLALKAKGDLEGAIRCFQAAVAIDPQLAHVHGSLRETLLQQGHSQQGHFAEARRATQQCLDLLPARDPLRDYAAQQLRQCERLLAAEEKLPAVLKGDTQPADAAERLTLAYL